MKVVLQMPMAGNMVSWQADNSSIILGLCSSGRMGAASRGTRRRVTNVAKEPGDLHPRGSKPGKKNARALRPPDARQSPLTCSLGSEGCAHKFWLKRQEPVLGSHFAELSCSMRQAWSGIGRRSSCFCKLGVLSVGVLIIRTLFGSMLGRNSHQV